MSDHLLHGSLLFDQSRYDLAAESFRKAIEDDPEDAGAHSMLGICLVNTGEIPEATRVVLEGLRLAPNHWYSHFARAVVMLWRGQFSLARYAVREAVRLNPHSADAWDVFASIEYESQRWRKSLAAAERGLRIQPQHAGCLNLRSMALLKLGRTREAGATIDQALGSDPEEALTQANKGWVLLQRGKPDDALRHFAEALRIDPTCEHARSGMVESLKAVNWFYRLLQNYFSWVSKLRSWLKLALGISMGVCILILQQKSEDHPELLRWMPFIVVFVVYFVIACAAGPISNLILRRKAYGRYLLSKEQTKEAFVAGGSFVVAVVSLVCWLLFQTEVLLLVLLYACYLMLVSKSIAEA